MSERGLWANNTAYESDFYVFDSNNNAVTGLVTGNFTKQLTKDGVNSAVAVTVAEIDAVNEPGKYKATYTPNATGYWSLRVAHTTYNPRGWQDDIQVYALDPSSLVNTALPNVAAGADGGVAVAGASQILQLKQLKINQTAADNAVFIQSTGSTAVLVQSTGGNGHGVSIGSNGSGTGINIQGGSTGHAISAAAGVVGNGAGLNLAGAGSGAGLGATGGATGHGLLAQGGATSGDGFKAAAQTSGDGIHGVGAGVGTYDLDAPNMNASFTANVTKWNGVAVPAPATAGIPDVNVKNYNNQVAATGAISNLPKVDVEKWVDATPNALVSGRVDASVGSYPGNTAQTGDAYARLGVPAGASVSADVAAIKSDTGTILTDVNVGAGAIYTRLGAPAGASIAADIAAVKTDTGAIETTVWDKASGLETGKTMRQGAQYCAAEAGGVSAGMSAAGGTATMAALGNPSTPRMTATLDANGNRTAVTLS